METYDYNEESQPQNHLNQHSGMQSEPAEPTATPSSPPWRFDSAGTLQPVRSGNSDLINFLIDQPCRLPVPFDHPDIALTLTTDNIPATGRSLPFRPSTSFLLPSQYPPTFLGETVVNIANREQIRRMLNQENHPASTTTFLPPIQYPPTFLGDNITNIANRYHVRRLFHQENQARTRLLNENILENTPVATHINQFSPTSLQSRIVEPIQPYRFRRRNRSNVNNTASRRNESASLVDIPDNFKLIRHPNPNRRNFSQRLRDMDDGNINFSEMLGVTHEDEMDSPLMLPQPMSVYGSPFRNHSISQPTLSTNQVLARQGGHRRRINNTNHFRRTSGDINGINIEHDDLTLGELVASTALRPLPPLSIRAYGPDFMPQLSGTHDDNALSILSSVAISTANAAISQTEIVAESSQSDNEQVTNPSNNDTVSAPTTPSVLTQETDNATSCEQEGPSKVDVPTDSKDVNSVSDVQISKRKRDEDSPSKKQRTESDDEDDGRVCSICLDYWTTTGEHRICALKCGHLFGHMCLERWLGGGSALISKTCPTCKAKASIRDIRFIFAKKIAAVDNEKCQQLQNALDQSLEENYRIASEMHRLSALTKSQHLKIIQLTATVDDLKQQTSILGTEQLTYTRNKINLEKQVEISKEDTCRVMAHNFDQLIVVSVKSTNPLFTGYGIRKIGLKDYTPTQFVPLHSKLIRDLAFHPQTGEWLLSVSMDKTAKLLNVSNNTVINTFHTDVQLWSCCWDVDNATIFYVGGQRGYILQYDTQSPAAPIKTLTIAQDMSPVISLACVDAAQGKSSFPRGALLCCKLNSCWAFEKTPNGFTPQKITLDGPFVALNYNKTTRQIVVSTRPNMRWVFCRHIVFQIVHNEDRTLRTNIIHIFEGATTQTLLSRNCQLALENDVLVVGYQENKRVINVWSVSSGLIHQNLPAPEPVVDMCHIPSQNSLVALTEKKIRVYSIK